MIYGILHICIGTGVQCRYVLDADGAIFHQSWEDRVKLMSECITMATQSGFPVYCTRLEEVVTN